MRRERLSGLRRAVQACLAAVSCIGACAGAADFTHFEAGLAVPDSKAAWQRAKRQDADPDTSSAFQLHCYDAASFLNTPAATTPSEPPGQVSLFACFRDRSTCKTFALLLAIFDSRFTTIPGYESLVAHDGLTAFFGWTAYSASVNDYELTDFGVIHEIFRRGPNDNLSVAVHIYDLGA